MHCSTTIFIKYLNFPPLSGTIASSESFNDSLNIQTISEGCRIILQTIVSSCLEEIFQVLDQVYHSSREDGGETRLLLGDLVLRLVSVQCLLLAGSILLTHQTVVDESEVTCRQPIKNKYCILNQSEPSIV